MAESIEITDVFDDDLCISPINIGANGTIDLLKNGDQILYLDQVGANIALAINAVTNLKQGFFERSIIGSDTYNVSWDIAFKSKMGSAGLTLPALGNGSGKRNNIAFVWNRAEGTSTDPTERITVINNHIGKASAVPIYTEPMLVSAEIGMTSLSILGIKFDKAVDASGIMGVSLTASGGALSVTSVQSGSGTPNINFALSRAIANGETVIITIAAVNNITSTLGGIAFAGITGQSVMTDTAPICLSAEVGSDDSQTLSVTFDRNIAASGTIGITLYNSGGAISVTSVKSVSSAVVKFNLSRVVVNGEAMTMTIAAVNNITNSITGVAFAGVTNKLVINTVPVINYVLITKTNIGEQSLQQTLKITFDISVYITNTTGFTLVGSSGTELLANGAITGSGSTSILINLNRALTAGETVTLTISHTNTITSTIDGTPYLGYTTAPVPHTVITGNFVNTAAPFLLQGNGAVGNSVAFSNGVTMVAGSDTLSDYIRILHVVTPLSMAGKHIQIRFINLVVGSGAFAIFSYYAAVVQYGNVSVGGAEVVFDIPVYSATNGDNLCIGDNTDIFRKFNFSCSKIYVDIIS